MLIPDNMKWGDQNCSLAETLLNNNLFINTGMKQAFLDISSQQAGQIGAFNTSETIIEFEKKAIQQGRLCKLASYSDYREYASLSRPKSFKDISKNPKVVSLLEQVYKNVNDVEFYIGLFAEDPQPNTPLPKLLRTMVAVDAFSQALTNPLLSEHVWKEETFSEIGWKAINETNNIRDIVNRNINDKLGIKDFIGMTRLI